MSTLTREIESKDRANLSIVHWTSEDRHLEGAFIALATLTTTFDPNRPWLTPGLLQLAASNGQSVVLIAREHVEAFLTRHQEAALVMHGAAHELRVLNLATRSKPGDRAIYAAVDRPGVWCTRLLHRLLQLGTGGSVPANDDCPLARCAVDYGLMSESEATAMTPHRSVAPNSDESLQCAARRAMATYSLFVDLWHRHQQLFNSTSQDTFGRLTDEQRSMALSIYGWQSHHIQIRAEIVLDEITNLGLGIDINCRDATLHSLRGLRDTLGRQLREHGYIPDGPGSAGVLQRVLERMQRIQSGTEFPRTQTGQFAVSQEALEPLRGMLPFVDTLLKYQQLTALDRTLSRATKPRIHAEFDVLKVTGRTSSFGAINAQNVPRDPRVRSVFVPSEGYVFLKFDYRMAELVALSGAIRHQFGWISQMHTDLSHDRDLHRLVAAAFTGKPESAVTDEERRKAKAINFGKPGGLGIHALRLLAATSYGVEMSEDDAVAASQAWMTKFPEMGDFLANHQRARFFGLTGASYFEHTGDRTFLKSGHETAPHPILAAMVGRVLSEMHPTRVDGRPYTDLEIDYFWSRVQSRIADLPHDLHAQIQGRIASHALRRGIMDVADRAPVTTLSGRLRANASYTAQRNTIFQGLAADGAKLALWWLWRQGYRIVNFIHDEILIEVRSDSDLHQHAVQIQQLMVLAMQQVVPSTPVSVDYAAMDRWYADAQTVYSDDGRLQHWHPPTDAEDIPNG